MGATINFEALDLIPDLLNKLENLNLRLNNIETKLIPKLDLTKRDGVKQYLGISDSTLHLMLNDGRLKQGIHFTKELKGNKSKITFIESAIKELKVS